MDGRNRVNLVRRPNRPNNFTALPREAAITMPLKSAGWGASKTRITERSQFWCFRFGFMWL